MTDPATSADHPVYGSLQQPRLTGGVVAEVEPGSAAAAAGLTPGDRLLTADGLTLRDVIDWQWIADESSVDVLLERESKRAQVTMGREPWQPWGLSFESPVFDRIRTCRNDCAFCFMSQLPGGLRPSLYLRDDDFRLSFLSGTFITLTNLTDADMARIATQRLSPLHVSLHAVTPAVREVLVCAHGEDCALERFDELVAAGIELHVQIVLVPGVNDGEELERTVTWLAERGEEVASVGIVPLGYTRHQDRFTHSFGDPASAAALLDAVAPWQTRMRTERDLTWLQAADEFYLAAGRPMPPEDDYDGYPQYENGIGMVRSFEDEWAEALADARGYDELTVDVAPATAVTGELFAPVLRRLVAQAGLEPRVSVLAVPNAAFGGNVTVAGLLTGADIAATIAADGTAAAETRAADAPYLVPDLVLNDDGLTLDDMTLSEVAEKAGAALNLVSSTAASLLMALGAVHPDSGPGEI